jgi:hypothetical protein
MKELFSTGILGTSFDIGGSPVEKTLRVLS